MLKFTAWTLTTIGAALAIGGMVHGIQTNTVPLLVYGSAFLVLVVANKLHKRQRKEE